MSKPMREVTKNTPKEGSDGPPSSAKNSVKEGKGHKQTGSGKKAADKDMMDQKKQQGSQNADPFRQLMQQASRNSRYALPLENQGTIDPNDPFNASVPDEHKNAPKRKSA